MRNDTEQIKKEKWRKASGVIVDGTNSALMERDYSIECEAPFVITIIKGYWLWWCSIHHQPLAWCEIAKLERK